MLLVFLITVSLIPACSSKDTSQQQTSDGTKTEQKNSGSSYVNKESTLPIVKEPITLKVHVVRNTKQAGYVEDQWFWKWAEKRTNIKFNVTTTDLTTWADKMNLMFVSGDLPDVFLNNNFTNSDITRFGETEKMLLPLNQLIKDYAPNISKIFQDSPQSKAVVTSPDGNIYTLPSLRELTFPVSYQHRLWVNQKWLDNLGMQQPTNVDELYKVLKAFKEQDPNKNGKQDEIPFAGSWNEGQFERVFFLTAFGLNASKNPSIFVKDKKVKLAEAEPEYAEYLKYMNKLFKEGLIDKNIFTQTQVQQNAISSQDLAGYHMNGAPHVTSQNWKDYASAKPLTSQWNTKPIWPDVQANVAGKYAISKDCKYPEAAVRFADLFFTKEYAFYLWYGPMVGSEDILGYPYAGWSVDDKGVINYPNMAPRATGLWDMCNYLIPINGYNLGLTLTNDDLGKIAGKPLQGPEKDRFWQENYNKYVTPNLVLQYPSVYFSQKQEQRIAELRTAIADYATMMEAKFITGAEPLSNINAYFDSINKLGVKEYVKIHQDAYDKYLAGLK